MNKDLKKMTIEELQKESLKLLPMIAAAKKMGKKELNQKQMIELSKLHYETKNKQTAITNELRYRNSLL